MRKLIFATFIVAATFGSALAQTGGAQAGNNNDIPNMGHAPKQADGVVVCPAGVLAIGWPAEGRGAAPSSGAPKPKLDEMYHGGSWGAPLPGLGA